MNQTEDYTPSLLAGLVRYRKPVAVTVLCFALLGALYAWTAWKPQAAMTVVVQVSDSSSAASSNPDRTTNEVAASLSSPEVISATEDASGVTIESIDTSWAQGQSTVGVLVAAATPEDAEAAASALLPAYAKVRDAQQTATLNQQLKTIDASLADVQDSLAANLDALSGVTAGTSEADRLQSERDALVGQRTQLQADRAAAELAAATPQATVVLAQGPDKGPGRLSLLLRYVPAAVVLGLLLAMGAVAVAERRRPWLAGPEMASDLLQAPLLGVGPGSGPLGAGDSKNANVVAPVTAMSVLRSLGDAPTGISLLVSCGGPEMGDGTGALARDMTPVLERAGAKVALLTIAEGGRAYVLAADGVEEEIDGLWNDFAGREEFVGTLREYGIDADLVMMVPVREIEHEVLLDLMLLSDVTIVATRTGSLLGPLFSLRRDFDALGREPHGVVADLSVE